MGLEAFLVNPHHKTLRRTKRGTSRRKHHGLPSALLRRMMKTYGPAQGMKRAWAAHRKGIHRNSWADDARGHRSAALKGLRRRRRTVRGQRKNPWASVIYPRRTTHLWRSGTTGRFGQKRGQKNPFGEEVLIVGNRKRRRHRKVSSLFGNRKRRSHRRKRSYSMNPRRRRSYRRHNRARRRLYARAYRRNPRRHSRRRYRRNPAASSSLPAISLRNPMSFLMPAAFGTAGFMAAEYVPSKFTMLGTSNWARFGLKAGVAFGGSMLLGRFAGKKNGLFFAVGAGVSLLSDVLRTFIFGGTTLTTTAGVGAFPYQVGAFPGELHGVDGFGAYPYEQSYPM